MPSIQTDPELWLGERLSDCEFQVFCLICGQQTAAGDRQRSSISACRWHARRTPATEDGIEDNAQLVQYAIEPNLPEGQNHLY
jgi:hypothetical protein